MIMGIPVLMYHEIYGGDNPGKSHPYAISKEMFEKQLCYMKANHYHTILPGDKSGQDEGKDLQNSRDLIITFDDTQLSNYTDAFPLLRKYDFRAVFFILTRFINQGKDFLTEEHIEEMSRYGMSIQSHTHSHAFLDDLDEIQIAAELKTSKTILEEIVKKEISLLSCPGGRFNRTLLKVARNEGYKGIFVSSPGAGLTEGGIFVRGRFLISNDTNAQTFEHILRMNRNYLFRKQLEHSIKNSAKKVLGNNLYHRFWEIVKKSPVQN